MLPKIPVRNPARGSALLLAIIMLAVLTAVAAAAVTLGSRERINAAGKSKTDFTQACANAAMAKIWAEMSSYGLGYLGSSMQVSSMSLPDGTVLTAPGHYDQAAGGSAPLVKEVAFRVESTNASNAAERDCSNKLCGPNDLGRTYRVNAHCKDAYGREYEVELALKFAI